VRRGFRDMNPTLRGFLIIAVIVAAIVALQLQVTVFALLLLARIAFFLALAYFLFMLWRDRREEIAMWSTRARVVFYGAALLLVANVASRFFASTGGGLNLIVFLAVFVLAGFAMWRVWRDQHSYSY
jgi:fucose 4-O-acetylase-like acetyltransferase